MEDEVQVAERLTRKRSRKANKAGGSGVGEVGGKINSSSTPLVPLHVIPLMTVYPISNDKKEVGKTPDGGLASGSRLTKK